MIVGIWVRVCLYLGLGVLLLNLILSLIDQLNIRKAFISDSDNPDFKDFQNAVMMDENWMENVRNYIDGKLQDSENEINNDK